eukprot:2628824-Prymnesium_polylepis.2
MCASAQPPCGGGRVYERWSKDAMSTHILPHVPTPVAPFEYRLRVQLQGWHPPGGEKGVSCTGPQGSGTKT